MLSILYNILIYPLVLIVEVIYAALFRACNNVGLSIIGVSIVVSFLVLPLYKRADEVQEEERERQKKMSFWVDHIKKTFKGDERIMLTSTYYRQQNYKQIYALRSSLSLLLQVPFFIAAYKYLSGLQALKGTSFLIFQNLSLPDGLFKINNFSVNVLPILMTVINCLSGLIYSKGFSKKEKIQIFALAAVFLVLLYNRPSGLVLYWTMNNVFSLIKNIVVKHVKNPGKKLAVVSSIFGLGMVLFLGGKGYLCSRKRIFLGILGFLILQLPAWYFFLRRPQHDRAVISQEEKKREHYLFILGGVLLALLTGLLIPSTLISASPLDFINANDYQNPLRFVVSSFCIGIGLFVVWGNVFYYLSGNKVKEVFSLLYWLGSGIALLNYMGFGNGFSRINSDLVFDEDPCKGWNIRFINLACILLLAVVLFFAFKLFKKLVSRVYGIIIIGVLALSIINISKTQKILADNKDNFTVLSGDEGIEPVISLSKTGNNVLVIMLDRGLGGIVEYLFNEKTELQTQFAGFVHYPNTISFGWSTNFGAPALYGGYEYTPTQSDLRPELSLAEKHDEALKVLPTIFGENGYQVTLLDPSLAGYKWYKDLSVFEGLSNVTAYNLEGKYTKTVDTVFVEQTEETLKRNYFWYSLFNISPVITQPTIYDGGMYFSTAMDHVRNTAFYDAYAVMKNLPALSETEEVGNTYTVLASHVTHELEFLQMPEYEPALVVDNEQYIEDHQDYYVYNGRRIHMETDWQQQHYEINMATYIQLGKWFDWMRQNGVYDNTRIIIVADHGYHVHHYDDLMKGSEDLERFDPILMVKDFNAEGEFQISYDFMTNADTPTLALQGLIDNPVNPYTGNAINSNEKTAHDQLVTTSWNYNIDKNNGQVFDYHNDNGYLAPFLAVHDDKFNLDNWQYVEADQN